MNDPYRLPGFPELAEILRDLFQRAHPVLWGALAAALTLWALA